MKMLMIFSLLFSLNAFAGEYEIDCVTEYDEIKISAKISKETGKIVNELKLVAFGEKVPVESKQLLRTFFFNGEFILLVLNSDRSNALVFLDIFQKDDSQTYEGKMDYNNNEFYNVQCKLQ
jgi:hypothetical protein